MRRMIFAVMLLGLAGCKGSERADNSATRYATSLRENVQKAEETRDKANAAVAQTQAAINAAQTSEE